MRAFYLWRKMKPRRKGTPDLKGKLLIGKLTNLKKKAIKIQANNQFPY